MNILSKLLSLFDSVDGKLIRGSGSTAAILYLMHYLFDNGDPNVCVDKMALAFVILLGYFIIEPLTRAMRHKG